MQFHLIYDFFSYSGALLEDGKLQEAVEAGLRSTMFVDLVSSLCSELKKLNQMQENVSKPSGSVHCPTCGILHLLTLLLLHRRGRCRVFSDGDERVSAGALLSTHTAHLWSQYPH